MFRLPLTAVDLDGLRAYAPGGPVTLTATGEYAVLDLWSETEEPEDDWFEAGQLAASLTPAGAPHWSATAGWLPCAAGRRAHHWHLDPDHPRPRTSA
jgi:hypothetical protein